nr:hypothetical protein [uncultured Hyphomonas sp.]
MSALKVSKPTHSEADAEPAANPEGSAQDWPFGEPRGHGDASPALKLQSLLADRLHKADRFPVRGTLAMLAVLCLSLSVAGLYLMTIA